MNLTDQLKEDFSKRLCGLMIERGYVTVKGKIENQILSKHSGCSLQMARRYLSGTSLPSPQIIEKISSWLDVDPYWLLFGSNSNKTDLALLKNLLVKMKDLLIKNVHNESMFLEYLNITFDMFNRISNLKVPEKEKDQVILWMIASAKSLSNMNTKVAYPSSEPAPGTMLSSLKPRETCNPSLEAALRDASKPSSVADSLERDTKW